MTEKRKTRAEEHFEREAKMLQRNLQKRKKQQEELDKIKTTKGKKHGQTKN